MKTCIYCIISLFLFTKLVAQETNLVQQDSFLLKIAISDTSNMPLSGIEVSIKSSNDEVNKITTTSNGIVKYKLSCKFEYVIDISSSNFYNEKIRISTNNICSNIEKKVILKKIIVVYDDFFRWQIYGKDDEKKHIIVYGDTNYMEEQPNCNGYWQLKRGLEDGVWIVCPTKKHENIVILAFVKNGLLEGTYKEWDTEGNYISKICEYKNGEIDGILISFCKIDGDMYTNIYWYKEAVMVETILIEF